MKICVYGASSKTIDDKIVEKVEELGELIAKRNHTLVFGGGMTGCMGAAARGAERAKAKAILGIAPKFFNVDGILFPNCTDFIYTKDMRERKAKLEEHSDAFIITPGGVGTYDEFFEILTLKQLGKLKKPIALYDIYGYFSPLLKLLEACVQNNFMNQASMSLFKVFTNPVEMFEYLENYEHQEGDLTDYKDVNTDIN
ncbi:MAG: TIGR00730 family Rossman fold protein [Clostridia bacterium]|nr:TIGR00730 family Rossman fold protein [Clostridia bacterium]